MPRVTEKLHIMMDAPFLPRGPGKTAPRLIHDLLDHDPRYTGRNGRNILADPAQKFRGVALLRTGPNECRHTLMKKAQQTNAPVSDNQQPDSTTKYVVATYCTQCRHHFDITVDFTQGKRGQNPCGLTDEANPMHHLRKIESWNSKDPKVEISTQNKYNPVLEYYRFSCSGSTCPVIVEIQISSPRLSMRMLQDLSLLDASKLATRGRTVIEAEPDRYVGLEPLSPIQVFSNLRQYLSDAKQARGPDDIKRIARRNKKYFLAFADQCDNLFTYLDFEAVSQEDSDGGEQSLFWQLPVITDVNERFIDDVLAELDLLISDRPPAEGKANPKIRVLHIPLLASKDIARSLGYHGFPARSRTVDLTEEPHPHYASLGALDSFTDDLLIWAYDRQCECDPRNKPYYLDCLSGIAKGRQSSDLQTKVVMATSAGDYGLQEIEDAYKFFTLDLNGTLTDDFIIGTYKSRIESAPRQQEEARHCLHKIAKARNSDKIEAVANDKTMSSSEALEFLAVQEDTDSEWVITQAEALVNEIGADTARIAAALRVIAKHRGGDTTLMKKAKAIAGDDDDVAAAYQALDIRNRSAPDETILMFYRSRLDADADKPVLLASHAKALRVIADDRESTFLWAKLADLDAVVLTPNEPVGLDNIGNTCYLNSLLQFYYTIKAVRNVVINIDQYKMDLDSPDIEEQIRMKQVGGRKIQRFEVAKAQQFISELRDLFEKLRTAPTKSVRPTTQLAELTLFSDTAAEGYRKKSISSPNGPPSLASILHGNAPVYGPEGPPTSIASQLSSTPIDEDIEMVDRPNEKRTRNGSETSESTLVEEPPPYGENMDKGGQMVTVPQKDTTFSDDPVDIFVQEDDAVMVNGENAAPDMENINSSPEKPPPVPPRNKAGLSIQTNNTRSDTDLLSFGAQQDVTEVINNVEWRLSCAIKPNSIDKISGEQIDNIRDTFFGANAVYTQKVHKTERKVESWQQIIVYPHSSGPRSIYEALDVVFDEQTVEVENAMRPQYVSITELPPVLQIQILRADFSILKGGFKNRNQVKTPETIYMDRYMDTNDPTLLQRRRDAWKWKTQLRALEARQSALKDTEAKVTVPDALLETQRFVTVLQEAELEGLEVDAELAEAIEERISEVAIELDQLGGKIAALKRKIEEQFTDLTQHEYKLQTVFIHRGEAGGGHYWIYLYDFEKDIWREYNDDHVSIVTDRNRIFNHDPQAGTPYFLGYIRSADKQNIVDAVVREVKEVKEVEMVDITNEVTFDEGIEMNDEEDSETRHIEHVVPRPILPKPSTQAWDAWENAAPSKLDANGRKCEENLGGVV